MRRRISPGMDPFDLDPLRDSEAYAERVLKDVPRGLGFCHEHWAIQKAYLKRRYGIDWKTPAERHPSICLD